MVKLGFLLIGVALAPFFGGCIGTAEGTDKAAVGGSDGVVVAGLVISEEIFPVAGAIVSLDNGTMTQTNGAGRFELGGVEPEMTYVLTVNATGYEPFSQNLMVPFDGVTGIQVTLKGIPGQAPYTTTLIFDGYNICSFSAVYSAGWPNFGSPVGSPCPLGQPKNVYKAEVGPDWRAGVHEMTWKTSEEMIFASAIGKASCQTSGQTHDKCPAMVWGHSPLRIFARIEDTAYAAKYAIDQKETWHAGNFSSFLFTSYSGYARTEINNTFYNQCVIINRQFSVPESWGCPFGIGVSMGIRFQFYHTTFYLAEPSDLRGFSALPDA